jgi:FkbM family methyltransferase
VSWIASLVRPRWVRRFFRPFLGRPALLRFANGRVLAVNLADLRGPSFHMSYCCRRPENALASFEPEGRALVLGALKRAGDAPVFLDLGANIGIYSFCARSALPAVTIYAFEPHPKNAECFALTTKLNAWKTVHLEHKALGDAEGEVNLYLDETDAGGHSIYLDNLLNNQAPTNVLRVPVTTLDAWAGRKALTRLDVIKLDVKGAEGAVVRGGLRTLAEFRPSLLVELQHETIDEPDSFVAALSALPFSYRVRALGGEEGDLNSLKEWAKARFQEGALSGDYFFTPVPSAEL